MIRCEDEKMRDRPPLLEEPGAQTLSAKKRWHLHVFQKIDDRDVSETL